VALATVWDVCRLALSSHNKPHPEHQPLNPNPDSPPPNPPTPPQQIKYIIELVEVLALPSPITRLCRKLKPWYGPPSSPWHVQQSAKAAASTAGAAAKAGVVQMGLLKQRVDVSLTADTFWVHHDAQVGFGFVGVGVGLGLG